MKKKEWNQGLDHIDYDLIEKYTLQKEKLNGRQHTKSVWLRVGALAACLVLILGAVVFLPRLQNDVPSDVETTQSGESSKIQNIFFDAKGNSIADDEELFYQDETYWYYFPNQISEYVTVAYTDGQTEPLIEALASGNVQITDLDTYGIKYYSLERGYVIENIIDWTEIDEISIAEAFETFYSDEEYEYYFANIISPYIIVYYKDGTAQLLRDALEEGNIKIDDLSQFKIGFGKRPKSEPEEKTVVNIVFDPQNNTIVEEEEIIYQTETHNYCFSRKISQYVRVRYTDGKEYDVKNSLLWGYITLADLDKYGIEYYSVERKYEVDKISSPKEVEKWYRDVQECFFEDENNLYFFDDIKSNATSVYYKDGTRHNIKKALKDEYITITDLDAFGVEYRVVPKEYVVQKVIDWTKIEERNVVDQTENFYSDDNYNYWFSSTLSPHIIVYYKNGTTQNIKDALKEGCIIIADLDTFGVEYQKDLKSKEIASIVDEWEGSDTRKECFYEDENFYYYFLDQKSLDIMVYYTDGTAQNLKEAFEMGRVTIADLDKFGIYYYTRQKGSFPQITFSDLKELVATYGEELTWEHFEGYDLWDSALDGFRMTTFIKDENGIPNYQLRIEGSSPEEEPEHIYLYCRWKDDDTYIDIRYEDIDEFLAATPYPW